MGTVIKLGADFRKIMTVGKYVVLVALLAAAVAAQDDFSAETDDFLTPIGADVELAETEHAQLEQLKSEMMELKSEDRQLKDEVVQLRSSNQGSTPSLYPQDQYGFVAKGERCKDKGWKDLNFAECKAYAEKWQGPGFYMGDGDGASGCYRLEGRTWEGTVFP